MKIKNISRSMPLYLKTVVITAIGISLVAVGFLAAGYLAGYFS